jgi:hypothetical protein
MGCLLTHCKSPVTILLSILYLLISAAPYARAQAEGQKSFTSSKDAVDAFIQAAREGNVTDLQALLGPDSEQIVSSGDDVADKQIRDRFVAEYEAKHSLVQNGPHQLTLVVGTGDWPLPIPLVDLNGKWFWNGAAGREEIRYRRIGRNELSTIDVCKGMVAAQKEYASSSHDGQPTGTYASRLVSETGKENGLYWEVPAGGTPSPAGPLLAQADAEGYDTSARHTPYHGYYYRMLKNPGGFGLLAYPAEYNSSGIMSFIVDQTGIVYQKDLGEKTAEIAHQITAYKRDSSWKRIK